MWSWIESRPLGPDGEPITVRHATVSRLIPTLRPSVLAPQVPQQIRVVPFRLGVARVFWDCASSV